MLSDLTNLLHTCGLNEKQQRVFLFLAEHGKMPASIIAQKLNMKRPTVYAVLESLVQMGIVLKQKHSSSTLFAAADPHTIPKVLSALHERKFANVQAAAKLLESPLQKLAQSNTYHLGGFEVMTLDSMQSMYAHLEEVLLTGNFCSIFNPQKALADQQARDIVIRFLQKTSQSQPTIRDIAVEGPMADWYIRHITNPHHQVKTVPAKSLIVSDIILTEKSVLLCHYKRSKELGIRIVHEDLYSSLMAIFEMVWETV